MKVNLDKSHGWGVELKNRNEWWGGGGGCGGLLGINIILAGRV